MSAITFAALIMVGLAAGVLSGMFGIGGGVVIVPMLTALLGFSLQQAVGTSLAALLMPVGIFAVLEYRRAGKLKLNVAAWIAVGLAVGALFGARLALSLPTDMLQRAYGLFLLFAAWRFAEPRRWYAEWRTRCSGQPPVSALVSPPPRTAAGGILLAVGLGAGVVSGMFGIGGGIVIVPALAALLHFDQKMAVGTSLGALLLPVSLFAVLEYQQAGQLDIAAALGVAAGLVVGALGGAKIALGLSSTTVKRLYGVFLFFVGMRFLLQG